MSDRRANDQAVPRSPQKPAHYDPIELGREVVRACLGLGFAAAGIARAEPSSRSAELREWLAAGKHGTMEWMEMFLAERLDVTRLLPGARAVIVVADAYAASGNGGEDARLQLLNASRDHAMGTIARYARGEDYHLVLKRRLKRLADRLRNLPAAAGTGFRTFVDTGPVMEREQAARAGLGWIGKHTLLIHPSRGSWFVLGGIATTLDLAPAPDHVPVSDHCGSCTRCIDACPTQAITPYSVDARRCISYLTIEHEGLISPEFHAGIGDRLVGCDVCQEVCPFNRSESADAAISSAQGLDARATEVNEAYSAGRGVGASLPLLEVLGWTEADRMRVMTLSAAKRVSLEMLKRNALIAARNAVARDKASGDARMLRARTAAIAADPGENELVRETARQVSSQLI